MRSIERLGEAIIAAWRFLTGETDVAREAIARVFEDNFDGLVVIGEDGRIIAASRVAAQLLLGNESSGMTGRAASELLPEPMINAVQQAFADGRRGRPTPMALCRIGDADRGGYVVQYVVNLSAAERDTLTQLVRAGTRGARTLTRSRVLLKADDGLSDPEVAAALTRRFAR